MKFEGTSIRGKQRKSLFKMSSCGSIGVRSLEGQAGITVGGEDLLDRVDVGGGSQVQAQVETSSGLHDGAS